MGVGLARIVGEDRHRLHRQFAAAPAVEKVDEAVVELRHHQRDPLPRVGGTHRPGHAEGLGERREVLAAGRRPRASGFGRVELDPHEEGAGQRVVELLRVENVEAAVEQHRRDLGDDARLVGAGQGENVTLRMHAVSNFGVFKHLRSRILSAGRRRGLSHRAPPGRNPAISSLLSRFQSLSALSRAPSRRTRQRRVRPGADAAFSEA